MCLHIIIIIIIIIITIKNKSYQTNSNSNSSSKWIFLHPEDWNGSMQSCSRYVTNTSSLKTTVNHLEWEKLEARRTKNRLVMFFEIIHGFVDIPAEKYLMPTSTESNKACHLNWITVKTAPSKRPQVRTAPIWSKWPHKLVKTAHIPKMKVKTAPSKNGPIFFFFFFFFL